MLLCITINKHVCIMYDNTQYALHSGEVPVTLHSVSIKAERNVVH